MTTQTVLTLFLASPGDVAPERETVVKVVEGFNKTVGAAKGVRVEVSRWETDALPAWGKDGQDIINEQLIKGRDHDLCVVIFWNRFGTPTPRAKSGTVEEFNLAVKSHLRRKRPQIMLYFSDAPATLRTKKELEQRQAVLDFKAGIKNGLYWSYKNKTDFREVFRIHFGKWLMAEIEAIETKKRPARRRAAPVKAAPAASPKPRTKAVKASATVVPSKPRAKVSTAVKKKHILLGGDVFVAESVTEAETKWTVVIRSTGASDDRKIRALGGSNQWQQFAFAYELEAGSAQVVKAPERFDDGQNPKWTIEVRFSPFGTNLASQFNLQGLTADEIAQKKAEWLLLGQKPVAPKPQNAWESSDNWQERHIVGQLKPVLPPLWKEHAADKAKFKAAVVLHAAHQLLKEGICNHIDTLTLGAIRNGKVPVSFRGTRSGYGGGEAVEVVVNGTCALEN